MFSQTLHFMSFYVRTTRWQCRKLCCSIWLFYHWMWHILYVLDLIITLIQLPLDIPFCIRALIHHIIFMWWFRQVFWNYFSRLMSSFKVEVCIVTCESYPAALGSCTIFVKTDRKCLYVTFKPPATSLTCTGSPTPQLIIILYSCAKISSKYNAVAYMYFSAQPYVLYHNVIISTEISCLFFNSSNIHLLCADVIIASCLVS